jgi:hypothetical protein
MSFEDERLSILQRVSKGEISPQDGQLEIAMLKVRHQRANEPGLEPAAPTGTHEEPRQQPPFAQPTPPRWPIAFAIALPLLLIGGLTLVMIAAFLALPTYVLVTVWNQLAPAQHWPLITYWPTLGALTLVATLLTFAQVTARLKALFQPPS